ncbi:MAG: ABC transporter permease [Rhodobacteraceae bacterium]|nr:ABC transporter permease [Paracoccaceae bacterium]
MAQMTDMGERRFGRVNWLGTATLAEREVRRFMAVWAQTLMAPLVTGALFLVIFTIAIGPGRGDVMGVRFIEFLAPGILMMTVIQNAFGNTSSSLAGAKIMGNIVDTLMPPLSPGEMLAGYLAGGIARGLFVGTAILALMVLALGMGVAHPVWLLVFVVLGSTLLGALGMMAGILANKFDQLAAITNFFITPLSFLSGTFYSIEAVPPVMQTVLHVNPMFYLIDGVRYGILGVSDSSPWLGLVICIVSTAAVCALVWRWLRMGYRLKS